jgi:D-amino-acid dehydrogenase
MHQHDGQAGPDRNGRQSDVALPVAVVGGGVIGLATAYHLRRRGADVVVLEANGVGAGASWGNAGWLVPSLSAPLAAPGMLRDAFASLTDRNGAFRIAPAEIPRLLPWLLRFAINCTSSRYDAGLRATARFAESVMDDYDDLASVGVRFEMQRDGLLFACLDPRNAEKARRSMLPMRAFGVELPDAIEGGDALRRREPALDQAVEAGFEMSGERSVHPGSLLAGLSAALAAMGVEVHERMPVVGFERRAGRVTAVMTPHGPIATSAIVLAAGAWTGRLAHRLGTRIPLQAGTGYSFSMRPTVAPLRPLYLPEAKAGTANLGGGRVRIAGTMALTGVRPRLDPARLRALSRAVAPYLGSWDRTSEHEHWSGMRPMTPDGLPTIGVLPTADNAYVSTGHAMLGVTLAPTSGRALASLMLDGRAPKELSPFSPARFVRSGRRQSGMGWVLPT